MKNQKYTLQLFTHVRDYAPIVTIKFDCGEQAINLAEWMKKSFTCCNVLAPTLQTIMRSHGSVYLRDERQEALEFEENRIEFEALLTEQQRSISL